jgi:hypothetical protein
MAAECAEEEWTEASMAAASTETEHLEEDLLATGPTAAQLVEEAVSGPWAAKLR